MSKSKGESADNTSDQKIPKDNSSGLSFFTVNDSDSSSESESEEDKIQTSQLISSNNTETANHSKLPSPSTLFATVGKPKFLDKRLEDDNIDWASLSKRYEPLYEYSSVSYPTETVDLSSAERAEASITGAPVKYKTEISETKRHLFLHGKRTVDLSTSQDEAVTDATQGISINTMSSKAVNNNFHCRLHF